MTSSLVPFREKELWEAAALFSDRRTFLDAVDAQRRRLRLKLVSDELLRKGATRVQRQRMRKLALPLRDQLLSQMRAHDRQAFKGQVAISINLRALGLENPPASPPAVKAYLDLLEGVVYADDSMIACLRVRRDAVDHPWFRRNRGRHEALYRDIPRIHMDPGIMLASQSWSSHSGRISPISTGPSSFGSLCSATDGRTGMSPAQSSSRSVSIMAATPIEWTSSRKRSETTSPGQGYTQARGHGRLTPGPRDPLRDAARRDARATCEVAAGYWSATA